MVMMGALSAFASFIPELWYIQLGPIFYYLLAELGSHGVLEEVSLLLGQGHPLVLEVAQAVPAGVARLEEVGDVLERGAHVFLLNMVVDGPYRCGGWPHLMHS